MRNLSTIGRIFFGVSIFVMGVLTIYYHDFPYMLIPPKHAGVPGITLLAYLSGILLMVAGGCIVLEKNVRTASLLLGTVLLLIFCFCFIPYQLIFSPNYLVFWDWENAAKELTLCAGAFVIAGGYSEQNQSQLIRSLSNLIPLGTVPFSLTIISYGIDHFLLAEQAADYVPAWVPYHLFWIYFTGAALLGSGIAIILNIERRLAAILLGTMIFTWFVSLHLPRIIVSPVMYMGSEVASACLALAYSGIAFVIAGAKTKG